MRASILCTFLFCVASVGFILWRVRAVSKQETPHFEIVKDPSASHGNGCDSLIGLAEQALETKGTASGSTLTVLVLGDQSTAHEPWRLGSYPVPTVRKVLEGRSARAQKQNEILRDISGKCQSLRRTSISPIFLGVTQGVADLHGRECMATSHCQLFVDSDLEENVESSVKKRIDRGDMSRRISLPHVDNSGIDVVFCGVAVTDGRIHGVPEKGTPRYLTHDSDRVHRVQDVWRSLFTEPAVVTFKPYCPSSGELGTRLAPGAQRNETREP